MKILITGASSGIGQALAKLVLEQEPQATLVLTARREERLQTIKAIDSERVETVCADISTPTGREKIIAHVSKGEALTHVVNNAATEAPVTPIRKLQLADYRQTQATNTEAPLFLTRDLLEKDLVTETCRVLFISSGAAVKPWHGLTAYAISKAALEMLCLSFKNEYADRGLAFATLKPGGVNTEIVARLAQCDKADFHNVELVKKRQLKSGKPMLKPKESAQFIKDVLLKTDNNSYSNTAWNLSKHIS